MGREKVREYLERQNELHINWFNSLKQWIDKKTEYLKIKEACESVTDASHNLAVLNSYQREKDNETNGTVPAPKKLGLTIIETKYEKLSSYSFPTPEEILGREKKVDEA